MECHLHKKEERIRREIVMTTATKNPKDTRIQITRTLDSEAPTQNLIMNIKQFIEGMYLSFR
jgi:hypothetical protein